MVTITIPVLYPAALWLSIIGGLLLYIAVRFVLRA